MSMKKAPFSSVSMKIMCPQPGCENARLFGSALRIASGWPCKNLWRNGLRRCSRGEVHGTTDNCLHGRRLLFDVAAPERSLRPDVPVCHSFWVPHGQCTCGQLFAPDSKSLTIFAIFAIFAVFTSACVCRRKEASNRYEGTGHRAQRVYRLRDGGCP